MASDLERGAIAGSEHRLYYNSATHAAPTWTAISRYRNFQFTDGPALTQVDFHDLTTSGSIPGYASGRGSFEYVRKRGTDTVFDFLRTSQRNKTIIELRHLNGEDSVSGVTGIMIPCLLGEFQDSANGNDPAVMTIQFAFADAYDSGGARVEITDVTIA